MKKRYIAVSLVVILVLSMCISAFARWSYTSYCNTRLTFSGTTAQCSIDIGANSSSSTIIATLKLIRENKDGTETTLQTWSGADLKGTGSLMFGATKTVTTGLYYRLEVTATVTASGGGCEVVTEYSRAKCP